MPIFRDLPSAKRLKIINETCEMIANDKLDGHRKMLTEIGATLLVICNGLGAEGAFFRIPATIWGTSIIESVIAHDYGYEMGVSPLDKIKEDNRFKANMYRQIDMDCKDKWYKPIKIMKWRANLYYQLVVKFGQKAFDQKVFPMNSDGE